VVNFATSKNLSVKSMMFVYRNIHTYNFTSPRWENPQSDWQYSERGRHSSVLDVRSFRAADCDSDHYLVVAKVKERLTVNKQRSHRLQMEMFNLKKLNEVEDKEKYPVES
jgi:hypothetical protein